MNETFHGSVLVPGDGRALVYQPGTNRLTVKVSPEGMIWTCCSRSA